MERAKAEQEKLKVEAENRVKLAEYALKLGTIDKNPLLTVENLKSKNT